MKTIKLTLAEIVALSNELSNPTTQTGILHETVSFTTKFYLNRLLQKANDIKASFEATRIDFINKLGVEDKTSITESKHIPRFIKDESGNELENPAYKEFMKEIKVLLEEHEHEIEYHPFTIEDFNSIKSGSFYPVFYKLVDN